MRNILKLFEIAAEDGIPYSYDELGTNPDIFMNIAKKCGFSTMIRTDGEQKIISIHREKVPSIMLYDKQDSNEFCFLDMGDLHIGDVNSAENILERTLAFYSNPKNGPVPKYVFLAGDLISGVNNPSYSYELLSVNKIIKECVGDIREKQVSKIVSILSKFDFEYWAINGNHEYTFDVLGFKPTLGLVEKRMKQLGKKFNFVDSYIVDFIIAGVAKRMMHLEQYYKIIPGQHLVLERVREFQEDEDFSASYNGKKYPIRFFHCGHLHTWNDMYDHANKLYISQPGSWIISDMFYEPVVIMKGRVMENGLIFRE